MADDPRIETGSLARQLPEEAHLVKRFSKFQDFVDEYSSRISLGGIFVRHDQLRPVGSEIYLDFRLEDDYRLLHGIGEVVWVRLKTMSEDRPKGMGIRFASLDEDGRELVLKLLEEQVKGGGEPFEVDKVPEDGSIDPSVVQAMEGPSSEEAEAAEQAKSAETAAREAAAAPPDADDPEDDSEDDSEDDEELPDLPPGVLPPPDEEADFSAPWGENLPDIPDDLLDESKKEEVTVPSVEAPESPYEPGSKEDDAAKEGSQGDLELTAPDSADPMLDETDFGLPKDAGEDDGTVFTVDAPGEEEAPAPAAEDQPWEPEDFTVAEEEPSFDAAEDESSFDVDEEEPSFDAPSFDAPSFDAHSFDVPSEAADDEPGELGAAGFDLEDETSSAVVPPEDMGDAAGAAFSGDYEPAEEMTTEEREAEEPEERTAVLPPTDPAMDAALDLEEGDFGGDDLDADRGEEAVAEPDARETAADEPEPAVAAAAEDATSSGEVTPARFAGDTPPISPADQAMSALPDLSDTVMGTRSPEAGSPETGSPETGSPEPGEETWQEGTYDDWEDWTPQTASQGKVSFLVVVAVLVLAGLGIAGYLYQNELVELVVGEPTTPVMSGGPAMGPEPPVGMDPPAAEPATIPEGVEPLPEGADPAGSPDLVPGGDPYDDEDSAAATPEPSPEEPATRAGADELRPPSAGGDSAGDRAGDTPARRIAEVDVSGESRGTVVSIRFDGYVDSSRYLHDPLAWAENREMVTLYGVENHPQTVIGAGTSELRRIRVGFHPGPELRLVFDLAGDGVSILSVEDRGDLLRVRLGR